jgi:hypothetical protein
VAALSLLVLELLEVAIVLALVNAAEVVQHPALGLVGLTHLRAAAKERSSTTVDAVKEAGRVTAHGSY